MQSTKYRTIIQMKRKKKKKGTEEKKFNRIAKMCNVNTTSNN